MLESDLKNKRKCSVCNRVGHDKRKCPLSSEQIEKNNTRKSSVVFVKVGKSHRRSPYVVNLRTGKENIWDSVVVYHDEGVVKEDRRIVDLAEMVRKANTVSSLQIADNKQQITVTSLACRQAGQQITKKKIEEKNKFCLPKFNIIYHLSSIVNLSKQLVAKIKNVITEVIKNFTSVFSFYRFAYSTIALLLLITIPFPAIGYYNSVKDTGNQVVEQSTNAFLSLQSSTVAALHANLDQAEFDLNMALESFGNANSVLDKEHRALQFVASILPVIGKQISSRQHLLVAGHHLALGNTYLVKGIRAVEEQADLNLTDKIAILSGHLRGAIPQYEEALVELGSVDEKAVPVEYQQSFNDFKVLFTAFVDDMRDILNLSSATEMIFGGSEFRRYLLVFQNNAEIRPTGGFVGSFAILDMQKGKIVNLDVPGGGTYDIQGQLKKYLKPPLPLQLINNRWEFQDANWFADFPASAKKMAWFYEQGRGATVDGVIAINASVLERILSVLGPMAIEDHGLEIASDNALEKLQHKVEVGYDKGNNTPKAVIGDLAESFVKNLPAMQATDAVGLLSELNEALSTKEIQVYFTDQDLQNKMSEFNWTGELLKTAKDQDYIEVVNTNIAGEKSDAKIEQIIEHQAEIQSDGSIIDTVVVHRKHTGISGQQFYGDNNVNYIRVYVPEGSELIDAGGFVYPPEDAFQVPENWYEDDIDLVAYEQEIALHTKTGTRITNEFGKTAFGNWMMTAPGNITSVYFVYRLPFKLDLDQESSDESKLTMVLNNLRENKTVRYSLMVQKQSGIDSNFSTRIITPDNWAPIWQTNDQMELAVNGAELQKVLKTDEVLGLVIKRGLR